MKALQMCGWKRPPEFRDVPEPVAGPGQVVIKVAGAGACHSDLHLWHDFAEGDLNWTTPFTVGHENAGWVAEIGAGVTGLEVGDAVAVYGAWGCGRCRTCLIGAENYCVRKDQLGGAGAGIGFDGGMAPYMLVPNTRWLVPLGDLDPVDAAPLTDAALTPYHAVRRALQSLTPGSAAVVIGIGGLGHMAIQILRAMTPAKVIAVDQRDQALTFAADMGTDHCVRGGTDAADEIRDLTRGGADVVIDCVGSQATVALGAAVVRNLGQLIIVGIGDGSVPVSFTTIAYEASVATMNWGTLPELVEVIALAESGRIAPQVTRFPLDRALDAYGALSAGAIEGRAVMVPDSARA